MRLPDPQNRIAILLIILVSVGALVVQLLTNHPAIGPAGLVLLAVPGFVISQAITPRRLGWPHVLLTTLATSLVLAVLIGIMVAISPYGLDSSSVANVELVVLLLAATIWLGNWERGQPSLSHVRIRVPPGPFFLIGLGLTLGGVGFFVATQAAQGQVSAGFVQLWSVPPRTGTDQLVGVRNATGAPLSCQVAIDRPGEPRYEWEIVAIDDGQTWQRKLPENASADPRPWEISLLCASPQGSRFDRRLTIDPPA
jgi:hypothetical protein